MFFYKKQPAEFDWKFLLIKSRLEIIIYIKTSPVRSKHYNQINGLEDLFVARSHCQDFASFIKFFTSAAGPPDLVRKAPAGSGK